MKKVQIDLQDLSNDASNIQVGMHKELKNKSFKTMSFIHQCVDKNVNYISSKETWEILKKGHIGDDKLVKVCLQTLRRKFKFLQMENNEKFVEYLNRITHVMDLCACR